MDTALFDQVAAALLETSLRNPDEVLPLPSYLQQAINRLAVGLVRSRRRTPAGLPEWFQLFERPLGDWWPYDLPPDIPPAKAFLYDGAPEDWLSEHLEDAGWIKQGADHSHWQFQVEIDQLEMRSLHRWCRDQQQPHIYRAIREFITRNPVTTKDKWLDVLGQFPLRLPITPAAFYQEPSPLHIHQSSYWVCPYCRGLLKWAGGIPKCASHSICGRLTDNYRKLVPSALPASYQPHNVLVVKLGHHLRTCIPGIPEMMIHDWLCAIARDAKSIKVIELWPDVDRYDLRLVFPNDETWVIDVKDLTRPTRLKRTVDEQLPDLLRLRNLGELSWSRFFFVVPDYREAWGPGYIRAANVRAPGVTVTSTSGFRTILARRLGSRLPKVSSPGGDQQ